MRILLTSQSSGFGGVERRWIKEAMLLKQMSNDVYWSTPRFQGSLLLEKGMQEIGAKRILWNPYKYIERQQIHAPFNLSGHLINHRIRHLALDLAHVAMVWTSVGMTRVRELGKLGIPVVLSLRCTYPKQKFPDSVRAEIGRALNGVIGAYAVSESVKQSFLDNFGESCKHFEIQVIHNGISTTTFSPKPEIRSEIRKEYSIPDNAFLIAFCGRLESMKGPQFALDLIESNELRSRNAHLILIGNGPEEAILRNRVQSGPSKNRVAFAGLTHRVPEILGASDIFLSCSKLEGFSSAVAEALSSGLPTFLPNEQFFQMFSSCRAVKLLPKEIHKDWIYEIANYIDSNSNTQNNLAMEARQFALDELDESIMYENLRIFYEKYTH